MMCRAVRSDTHRCRCRGGAFVLAVLLAFGAASYAPAAPVKPPATIRLVAAGPMLASGWGLGKFWSSVESLLGSQRGMIRLGMIGMAIGLFILMRK